MNRDKIGTETCYVHQHNLVGTLMYIACLCLPILHFKFPKYLSLVIKQ